MYCLNRLLRTICMQLLKFISNTNKSNSTARAVRVEANLLGTSAVSAIFYSKRISRKCLTLKLNVKVTEYTNRNGSIRWQMSISIKIIREHFFPSSPRFRDIHISKFLDPENVCPGHDEQHSQWHNSMANTCKYLTSYLMPIVMFAIFDRLLVKIAN